MNPLLDVRGLSFAYPDKGARRRRGGGALPDASPGAVLRDVSFTLGPGEVVSLLGPNGSGKSTLLRALLGVPGQLAGQVLWEGVAPARQGPGKLSRSVAYLPQAPAFDAGQSVADILRLGRLPHLGPFGAESPTDIEVVERVAESLGLTPLMDRQVDRLSGGQRQRVFLGRCLVQEPRALLLDEPASALDLRYQAEVLSLLRRLARTSLLAVLIASHDLNLSAAFSDRLVLLRDGAVAAQGAPADVLDAALLSRIWDVPMQLIGREGALPLAVPILSQLQA